MPVGTPWYDQFLAYLRDFVDDQELSDLSLFSWIAMAEERFNNELRVREMVRRSAIFLADQCIRLPDDFLELISVRYTNSDLPLRYISSDHHWRAYSAESRTYTGSTDVTLLDPATGKQLSPPGGQPAWIDYGSSGPSRLPLAANTYTLLGDTMFVSPRVNVPSADVDPTEIELAYYAKVPPINAALEPTQLFQRAPKLYTYGALAASAPFLGEDDRTAIWDGNVTAMIKTMNEAAHTSRVVSSPLRVQVRTFG